MKTPRVLALTAIAFSVSSSFADYDILERHLFEPEIVMKHQRDIGLSADQRETIKKAVQDAQTSYVDLEWELEAETAEMEELLEASPIDLMAVLTQADIMLDLENKVKISQLTMLVQIKNVLSRDQQDQLMQLRTQWWGADDLRKMME